MNKSTPWPEKPSVEEMELLCTEISKCMQSGDVGISQGVHDKYTLCSLRLQAPVSQVVSGWSEYDLGLKLLHGIGCKADPSAGCKLVHRAAVAMIPEAISLLGYCYEFGHGVAKDESVAVKCYTQAAHMGDPHGMVRLGRATWEGLSGLKKDAKRAEELISSGKLGLELIVDEEKTGEEAMVARALSLLHTQYSFV